ncbi:hypothetical protein Hte_006851 [Hypoxylon texense]
MGEAAKYSQTDAEASTSQQVPAPPQITWTGYGNGVGGVHDHIDDLLLIMDRKFEQMRQESQQLCQRLDQTMAMVDEHFQTTTAAATTTTNYKGKATATSTATIPTGHTQTEANSGARKAQDQSQAKATPTPTPTTEDKSRLFCGKCGEQFPSRNKLMKHVYSDVCSPPSEELTEARALKREVASLRGELKNLRRRGTGNQGGAAQQG